MGYQALLFCPEEKTARAVTQVLSELDFTVEPSTEPFAAVKKLMAQHFDAVVVDCDNEQNATLLFKSARNSSANQSSLAVAVVEGQAGVAKAFRIGANLVLTKPINVEQAKGTLRVARGLLRKGGESAKPGASTTPTPAGIPTAPVAAVPSTPVSASTSQTTRPIPVATKPSAPAVAAPKPQAQPQTQPKIAAFSPSIESPAEPVPTMGRESGESVAADSPAEKPEFSPAKKSYPWQPSRPGAEPMASAMRKAAEGASTAQDTQPAAARPEMKATTSSVSMRGAATAPAPAKEKPVAEPVPSKPAEIVEKALPKEVTPIPAPASPEVAPPAFSMGATVFEEEEPSSNKKALIIVAAVVVLAALAGFLGWKNLSGKSSPATQAQVVVPAATTAATENPASPGGNGNAPVASNEPAAAHAAQPSATAPASKPSAASKPAARESSAPSRSAAPASEPEPEAEQPAPMVVKNEGPRAAPKAAAPEPDVAPPSAIGVGETSDAKALAAISNAPVSVPRPSSQVVKISQGVSEGLVLKRVQPRYPSQAIQMRLEGAVQLQATISKDGNITNLKALSGDAMLARAALDAVRQWKYKPYYLNGEPVDIQTQIVVNFKLPR